MQENQKIDRGSMKGSSVVVQIKVIEKKFNFIFFLLAELNIL